jgi:transposase
VVQHPMQASPDTFLTGMAPDRDDRVVAVEGLVTWYGMADLWAQAGIPCVRGHARSMPAMDGGQAHTDQLEAHKMAVLRRGGLRPEADVDPAERRATRDLWRRRRSGLRQRAALLTPVPHTTSPYHWPAIGKKLAYQANRAGVAERFPDPAVPNRLDVERAWLGSSDHVRTERQWALGPAAPAHPAPRVSRLRSIPGVGQLLARVWRSAIHDLPRVPRVQAVVSECRLGTGATPSAATRDGSAGPKSGTADLPWTFSAAAGLGLWAKPAGHTSRARGAQKHGQGPA